MVKPAARIVIKFLELLGCVACVITKIITDHESRRVFVRNQKLSREWSLIHNITWSSGGNAFTNIVYGGYTIVIALMLITRSGRSTTHYTTWYLGGATYGGEASGNRS
uniref:Uncharacterized protein n=1 Tax=Anopheles stephensi TaxID=30069 RepID=A0A182YAW5_ANOST